MTDCKINFTKESEPLAYGIYQDLLEAGASCTDLDYGYNVTNYAGLYCPAKDARSCVIGKGDGVVEADEVKEYALDNYEQAKYRQIIEGRLGEPLPWVLDDLDPNTPDDNEIREKVIQPAINELKRIITAKGIAEGSEKYNEMLAAGLTWFVAMPPVDKAAGKIVGKEQNIQRVIDGIKKDGLKGFWEYLEKNGGIRVDGDYSKEYTAIEALRNKNGECTETSKILFAAMKMARLKPVFIFEDLLKEEIDDPIIKKAIEELQMDEISTHMCIGLYVGGRIRFFDPATINSNASYRFFTPLSLRQYLSMDYTNRSSSQKKEGEINKAISNVTMAIEIDQRFAPAYFNRSVVWQAKGESDEAIADLTIAIKIDPKFAEAYFNLANECENRDELDKAIIYYTESIECKPRKDTLVRCHNNRGFALEKKGKLDEALADYTIVTKIDPKLALPYYNCSEVWYKKGELNKTIANIAKAATLDQVRYYDNLLTLTKKKWQSSEGLKNAAKVFREEMGGGDISGYEAQFALAYALWEFENYEDAQKTFNGILTYLSFKTKPSKSTTDFFNDMLQKMPAPMKKDKGVQEMLKALREKMK